MEKRIETVTYKNRRFEITDIVEGDGRCRLFAQAWHGNAKKSYAYFRFTSPERRAAWVDEQKAAADAEDARKATQKAEDATRKAAMLEKLTVGTILAHSYGYDQTNVVFYQITGRSGSTVTIRKIKATLQPSEGLAPMSGYVYPCPGEFVDGKQAETLRKRIQPCGIVMDYGIAKPTDPCERHYCSWYA